MSLSNRSYYRAINTQAEKLGFDFFKPPENSKPPTIMQVLPALESGGVERGTIEISEAIIASGWNSLVVSKGGILVEKLEQGGAKHIKIDVGSKNPLRWHNSYTQIRSAISTHKVDLVHARSRMPAWLSKNAAQASAVPFITTFHGRYADTNFVKKIYNSIMVQGSKVIAISQYLADDIRQRYDVDDQILKIIPRGADLEVFDTDSVSQQKVNELKQDWNISSESPIIILPARLTRWKGHELLIDALSQFGEIPYTCIFVGSYKNKQKYKSKLQSLISENNLDDKIRIVGHCRDMAAAYKLADVVVAASLDPEPFGRVAVEAQAMGCILVAADHGGTKETIVKDETGILVQPGNSNSLTEGIKKALTMTPTQRSTMSTAAKSHITANFSRNAMCYRTMSLYCDILGISPKENY